MISNTAEACPCRHLFIESPQDRAANPHDITKGRKTGIRKKKKKSNPRPTRSLLQDASQTSYREAGFGFNHPLRSQA